jgi:hypothetical protein
VAVSRWEDRVRSLRDRATGLTAAGLHRDAAAVPNEAGLGALDGGLLETAAELFEQVAVVFEAEGYETEASAAQTNLALVASRSVRWTRPSGATDDRWSGEKSGIACRSRCAGADGEPRRPAPTRCVSRTGGLMVEPDVPTTWWLGFWRAGEHLYWWTTAVSPTGDRDAVRAAVQDRVTRATLRQAVDPDRAAPGPVPAEAAFVAAGAIAWSDVEPHLAVLAAAVPVQVDPSARAEADDLARRLRRITEVAAMTLGTPDDEERAALIIEQIALRWRTAELNRAAVDESLTRAWSGPLVDVDANVRLCRELGALLLPAVLREYLAAQRDGGEPTATVVVAPAPELGLVPWDLLTVQHDVRLLERAFVRGGISPATVADLALPAAPDAPDLPGLLVVDPTGGRPGDPVPLYPGGLPDVWTAAERARRGDEPHRDCSRARLGTLLRENRWGRFVFHGHVSSVDALSPTAAALVLADDRTDDPPVCTPDGRALEETTATHRLSARVWLHRPQQWPLPRRVGIIACQADDASYIEQTGLTLAALNAGARIVTTTRWTLPGDASARADSSGIGPTTAVALAVDDSLRGLDPGAALRTWQFGKLRAWRSASTPALRRAHAPLLWASLVTYVLPDQVASALLPPVGPH